MTLSNPRAEVLTLTDLLTAAKKGLRPSGFVREGEFGRSLQKIALWFAAPKMGVTK